MTLVRSTGIGQSADSRQSSGKQSYFCRVSRPLKLAATLACTFALHSAAYAQTVTLPGSDYGRITLPLRESLGAAATFVRTRGNVFEPISQLRPDDRLARLARSVGRIDIQTAEAGEGRLLTCTGTLITRRHIITNHHCALPNGVAPRRMSMVFDYLEQTGRGARRLELEVQPQEGDKDLDYVILRLKQEAPSEFAPVRLAARRVQPRQGLKIIHHPGGQPKVITRFRCQAARSNQPEAAGVRHTCDTLPGSSGALLLDRDENLAIGLHHTGGLSENDPNSFNGATSIYALTEHSEYIRALVEGRSPTQPSTDQRAANALDTLQGSNQQQEISQPDKEKNRLNNLIKE